MKTIHKYFLLFLAVGLMPSCKKYVDIKTQGNLVPNQVINYRYLLNNNSTLGVNPSLGDFASDDLNIVDAEQVSGLGGLYYGFFTNSYTWSNVIYPIGTTEENDNNWNTMYSVILYCNTIINEVPGADGAAAEKSGLIAEALVHRADAYLSLVNLYAKPYNSSTAANDLGLPLLLTQTISQSLKRASVQAIYDQVVSDLTTAIPSLPNTQALTTLPSKASAYGELARCYLYMKDYTNAGKYADLALASRSTLVDMRTITDMFSDFPKGKNNPEILLSKTTVGGAMVYGATAFRLSDELLSLLGTDDLRYKLLTADASMLSSAYTGRYYYQENSVGETRNVGPSVPEMMLIKAEYLARNNDAAGAMQWVNKLREKRFATADYVEMTATSPADALIKVIQERRREFFGRMLRWWDMRRLKDEAPFQRTYTREFNGQTYTLTPNSNRYVFPIAVSLRQLNPELEANP